MVDRGCHMEKARSAVVSIKDATLNVEKIH